MKRLTKLYFIYNDKTIELTRCFLPKKKKKKPDKTIEGKHDKNYRFKTINRCKLRNSFNCKYLVYIGAIHKVRTQKFASPVRSAYALVLTPSPPVRTYAIFMDI